MSMQIVEKSGEGLSRVFGVTVPAADLEGLRQVPELRREVVVNEEDA